MAKRKNATINKIIEEMRRKDLKLRRTERVRNMATIVEKIERGLLCLGMVEGRAMKNIQLDTGCFRTVIRNDLVDKIMEIEAAVQKREKESGAWPTLIMEPEQVQTTQETAESALILPGGEERGSRDPEVEDKEIAKSEGLEMASQL